MKKLILTLLFMGATMAQEKFYGFEFVKESGGIKEYTMTSNGLVSYTHLTLPTNREV